MWSGGGWFGPNFKFRSRQLLISTNIMLRKRPKLAPRGVLKSKLAKRMQEDLDLGWTKIWNKRREKFICTFKYPLKLPAWYGCSTLGLRTFVWLFSTVRFQMSSKKRVEPSEPPGKLAGWLLVDKLVVVGGLVQGLLEDVGWVVGEVMCDVLFLFMNGEQMSQNKIIRDE